jgi:hypothetical protein
MVNAVKLYDAPPINIAVEIVSPEEYGTENIFSDLTHQVLKGRFSPPIVMEF